MAEMGKLAVLKPREVAAIPLNTLVSLRYGNAARISRIVVLTVEARPSRSIQEETSHRFCYGRKPKISA